MTTTADKRHPNASYYIFLFIIGIVFVGFTIVFLFFPRTKFSELEKRDLAEFPDISNYDINNLSQYPSDISTWFSDSEPYRDLFMTMSMQVRGALGYNPSGGEEAISFKASDAPGGGDPGGGNMDMDEDLVAQGNPMADADAKRTSQGSIVVGSGQNVRAFSAFGAGPTGATPYLNAVSEYARAFPNQNVYAMIVPSESEFYLPQKGASLCKPQKPVLDYVRQNLPANVKWVDAYKYLAAHTNEDIYLRTDHHWSPLGAFYGAKAFAQVAGVPFKELDSYDKNVIHGFVGSMYGYTKDIAIKNAPEDFVYYTPRGLDYKTSVIAYKTNKNYQVVSASAPREEPFFHKFNDGSGNAYLTFMGGDQKTVKITTGTNSPRKLLIIKDSYGNALPGYLFYSFGEIHSVDFRYFPRNIKQYVSENGITDILIENGVHNACGSGSMGKVTKLLTNDGSMAPATAEPAPAPKAPPVQTEKAASTKKDAAPSKTEKTPSAKESATKTDKKKESPAEKPKEEKPKEKPEATHVAPTETTE